MNKVSIIIAIYNRLDMVAQCLNAIRKNSNYPYELILIDNGSDMETAQYIQTQKDFDDIKKIFRFRKNRGFAAGYNKGLSFSDQHYRIIINSDTKPYDGWLNKMIEVAETNQNAGLILPYTTFACNPHIVCKEEFWKESKSNKLDVNEDVPAVCWMITDKCYHQTCLVIKKLGGGYNFFHSKFKFGWAEDILTSIVIRKLGFERYVVGGSFIYHYGMATQRILTNAGNYRKDNMIKLKKYLEKLNQMDWSKP